MSVIIFSILIFLGRSQVDYSANYVYGQNGQFTTSTVNNPSLSSSSLSNSKGVAFDFFGGVYIADTGNNRVLYYPNSSTTTATRVYGQLGSFSSSGPNTGGLSSLSLASPSDVALDSGNGLYIADSGNNRVLFYPSASTTPTFVYGQGGNLNSGLANNGGVSANSLFFPNGVAVSGTNLYVADTSNHRVLKFTVGTATATSVWGQASFTVNSPNRGGGFSPTADTLAFPRKIAISSSGLFVADEFNSRVLYYSGFGTTATRVYGQNGVFSSGTAIAASATSLGNPAGVAYDSSSDTLYISDTGYNRVLYYQGSSTTAVAVYGQGGSLTGTNDGSVVTAKSLSLPYAIAVRSNSLLVIDSGHNRALRFQTVDPSQLPSGGGNGSATCFHESTIIDYGTKSYSMDDLVSGLEKECRIPHVVKSDGIKITIRCFHEYKNKTYGESYSKLRLTADHLIRLQNGLFVSAKDIAYETRVNFAYTDPWWTKCYVDSKEVESDQTYFGLNCLRSVVYANGVEVSTFGSYHELPATWMHFVGRIFGIERASRWGDNLAQLAKRFKIY